MIKRPHRWLSATYAAFVCQYQRVEFAVRQPFPLLDVMPPVLDDVVLGFVWDRKQLWNLDLPETWFPMAELDWRLRLPMWVFQGRPFVLTPAQVAQNPRTFSEQYARTVAADISFPLHVLERPNRLTVLDGMHRLLQAHLKGYARVVVKKLPIGRLDEIACFRL